MKHRQQRPSEPPDIDFVVLWVNGSDPDWLRTKARFAPPEDPTSQVNGAQRYRDWGLMKYWFRGVEKYAPWVRKIHFVSDEQYPAWLNRNAPKLACVSHRDFIPAERLPLFNSCAIEMHLHRIPDIAEHFVEFNDDMFIGRPIAPRDVFPGGSPVCSARLTALGALYPRQRYSHCLLNEAAFVRSHHDWRKTVFRHPSLFLLPWRVGLRASIHNALAALCLSCPGVADSHLPYILKRTTVEEAWAADPDLLTETASHRFRTFADVSVRLFRDWQIASGEFTPRRVGSIGKRYSLSETDIDRVCSAIVDRRHPFFCANDDAPLSNELFERLRRRLSEAFEASLPEKSSFEL